MDELTYVDPNRNGGNILAMDDPELFKYPWAYLCEVGFWTLTEPEAAGLRAYLQKGGFLGVDDFMESWQWDNFEMQMAKVLPGARLFDLDLTGRRADYEPLAPEKFGQIQQRYQFAGGLIPDGACGYIARNTA